MSEDSIKTIQGWIERAYSGKLDGIRPSVGAIRRMNWLISELEQCKAEIKELEKRINKWRQSVEDADIMGMGWKDRAEKAEAENIELQAVFDLERTRTRKAEKMWQRATGKHNTMPDLGVLLDWLMSEVKRLKKMQPIANVTLSDDAKYYERVAGKQRRHRKWALKEMYMWRARWQENENDVEWHYKQAEKHKAEVGRLKSILANARKNF